MEKFVAVLTIAAVLGLAGCSIPVAAPAPADTPVSTAASLPASERGPGVEDPGIADATAPAPDPGITVQRPVLGAQPPAPAAPTMSVDEVCRVWKEGFKVLNEGRVSAKEAMAPLEEATSKAPPEIRVQSGIATRILWGQLLYPSKSASDETVGYLAALRQACYDLTGIDVVEGIDG